jgi:hypothetical protein
MKFAFKIRKYAKKEWKIVKIRTDNLMVVDYFEKHEPSIPIQFDIDLNHA